MLRLNSATRNCQIETVDQARRERQQDAVSDRGFSDWHADLKGQFVIAESSEPADELLRPRWRLERNRSLACVCLPKERSFGQTKWNSGRAVLLKHHVDHDFQRGLLEVVVNGSRDRQCGDVERWRLLDRLLTGKDQFSKLCKCQPQLNLHRLSILAPDPDRVADPGSRDRRAS